VVCIKLSLNKIQPFIQTERERTNKKRKRGKNKEKKSKREREIFNVTDVLRVAEK